MDRRTEPPIWPPDESEIPDENEIPERRRRSPALLLFGWTCARDGLAHAAALVLTTGDVEVLLMQEYVYPHGVQFG